MDEDLWIVESRPREYKGEWGLPSALVNGKNSWQFHTTPMYTNIVLFVDRLLFTATS